MSGPSIIRSAHGTAKAGGALIVAETPVLAEIAPLNASDTERGVALSAASGRPFTRGNQAAKNRGPSLTRTGVDLNPPDHVRRGVQRRAESLRRVRVRELRVAHGGSPLSSAVKAEVASWALAVAWSRFHYDQGDAKQGARFAELASAHQLRAVGLAEREQAARPEETRSASDIIAAQLSPEQLARIDAEVDAEMAGGEQETGE